MPVTVTCSLFSGRPDPAWELSDSQIEELRARLGDAGSSPLPDRLGYRGFVVHSDDPRIPPLVTAAAGSSPELESFLAETGKDHLPPAAISMIHHRVR